MLLIKKYLSNFYFNCDDYDIIAILSIVQRILKNIKLNVVTKKKMTTTNEQIEL